MILIAGGMGGSATAMAATPTSITSGPLDTKSDCAYSGPFVDSFTAFSAATGHDFTCAMVFNNQVTTWTGWDTPWFDQYSDPNQNWAVWKGAQADRQLIITEDMVPSGSPKDWRAEGAAGLYDPYALALAQNLVGAGLGGSVIRLGHEANFTDPIASVGKTALDRANWVQYWRNIVLTMRTVPGAHFLFDWNVLAGYRRIPFASFYPGDDVVDMVSIDAYDGTIDTYDDLTAAQHWSTLYFEPLGLGSFLGFADLHAKPIAFPEWSIEPGGDGHGFGDDPLYIDKMSRIVASRTTVYQSYWNVQNSWNILESSPPSWAAYLGAFGGSGTVQGRPLNPPL